LRKSDRIREAVVLPGDVVLAKPEGRSSFQIHLAEEVSRRWPKIVMLQRTPWSRRSMVARIW
jgi:hypothetical protein